MRLEARVCTLRIVRFSRIFPFSDFGISDFRFRIFRFSDFSIFQIFRFSFFLFFRKFSIFGFQIFDFQIFRSSDFSIFGSFDFRINCFLKSKKNMMAGFWTPTKFPMELVEAVIMEVLISRLSLKNS